MSSGPSREDLRACGTLLNTLDAENQGAFAHATLLASFQHPDFDEAQVVELQARMVTILGWNEALLRRKPILFVDGREADTADLEQALSLLDDLAQRLERVGRELEGALDAVAAHEHDGEELPDMELLLAGLAWTAISHESELHGAISHGQGLDDPELAARAQEQLPLAEDALQVLQRLLARVAEPGPPGCDLLGEIHRSAAHLPRAYGAKTEALRGLAAEIRELRG